MILALFIGLLGMFTGTFISYKTGTASYWMLLGLVLSMFGGMVVGLAAGGVW